MVNADDMCGVCGTRRDEHGDKNHQFNLDGQLLPLQKAPISRKIPQTGDLTAGALLRLVERLIVKDILQGDDLVYIFGGGNGQANRGSAENSPGGYSNSPTPE